MKKLFSLVLLEKLMLSILMILICLLIFLSYKEQSKHIQFIDSIQPCTTEKDLT